MTQNSSIFFRDFDHESEVERQRFETAPAQRKFTDAELSDLLEDAKKKGYEEGFEKGTEQGIKTSEASILAQQSTALERISDALPVLTESHEKHMKEITQDTLGLMEDVLTKVLADIVASNRMAFIHEEVKKSLIRALKSSWIEIKVPEDICTTLSEHIQTLTKTSGKDLKVTLVPDNNISASAVISRWEAGNSEYDAERLCEKIIDTISSEVKE